MRILILVLCGLLQWGIATPARAAPCVSQSLADFVGLGAAGCTVAGVSFSDFTEVTPLLPGAVQIHASSVVLTPLVAAGEVGFSIDSSTRLVAGAGELLELWFGFRVSGGGLVGNAITLAPPAVTFDGAITLIADVCRDGSFSSPSVGCSGTPEQEVAFAIDGDSQLDDADAFAPSSFFDVFVDLVVDGGVGGGAELGPQIGAVRATSSGAVAVPEPGSALLAAAALSMLWAPMRRTQRTRR